MARNGGESPWEGRACTLLGSSGAELGLGLACLTSWDMWQRPPDSFKCQEFLAVSGSGQCSQQLHVFRALLIGPPPCPPPRPLGGKQEGGREGRLPQGGPPGLPAAPPTPGRTPRSTSAAGSGGSGPQ